MEKPKLCPANGPTTRGCAVITPSTISGRVFLQPRYLDDSQATRQGESMELIPEAAFLEWVARRDVGIDERYSDPRYLVHRPYRDSKRFWECADEIADTENLIGDLLEGMRPWSYCRAWSRGKHWPSPTMRFFDLDGNIVDERPRHPTHCSILQRAGVPSGEVGALEYEADEAPKLAALLAGQVHFGFGTGDDVFVVSDNGRYLVHSDHHDVVWVSFREETTIQALVDHMAACGHSLPEDTPDPTFKTPEVVAQQQGLEFAWRDLLGQITLRSNRRLGRRSVLTATGVS